jgi:hypothetical protein
MATRFNRQRTPLDRLNSAKLPSTLVALLGNEAVLRGALRARVWLLENWSRGVRESRSTVKPLRKVARREWRKSQKLRGMVPFYPAIPLVPVAVVAGLATFSTVLAVRLSRRDRDIMDRLDAIESDLARMRQQREQQVEEAASEGRMLGSQPAQLPWT